jgi:tetratricopeptide (TPR) repeat protein
MSNLSHSDAIAKNDEGMRLLNAEDFEGAVAAFSAALTLYPDFEAAYRNRADALRRLRRVQEAEADSDKAESIRIAREKVERVSEVTCAKCVYENPARAEFCAKCGSRLASQRRDQFRKGFARTAIPIVALSIASTVGVAAGVNYVATELGWSLFLIVWLLAAAAWLGAIVATVILYGRGQRWLASGVLAGVGIGVIALGATLFANVATIGWGLGYYF